MEHGLHKVSITISVRDNGGLDEDQDGKKQTDFGCV